MTMNSPDTPRKAVEFKPNKAEDMKSFKSSLVGNKRAKGFCYGTVDQDRKVSLSSIRRLNQESVERVLASNVPTIAEAKSTIFGLVRVFDRHDEKHFLLAMGLDDSGRTILPTNLLPLREEELEDLKKVEE